jgi:hypothetical protein
VETGDQCFEMYCCSSTPAEWVYHQLVARRSKPQESSWTYLSLSEVHILRGRYPRQAESSVYSMGELRFLEGFWLDTPGKVNNCLSCASAWFLTPSSGLRVSRRT